jgi:hypothetical protein
VLCGRKGDEVRGDWKKLDIEELQDLYFSPNIIPLVISRMVRWGMHGEEEDS